MKDLFQLLSVLFSKGLIVSFDQVMVQGCIWAPRGADCHRWKVQLLNWIGGYGGGHRGLLPSQVGFADQQNGDDKTWANCHSPSKLVGFGLDKDSGMKISMVGSLKNSFAFFQVFAIFVQVKGKFITSADAMWWSPWIVEFSKNSLVASMSA